MGGRNLLFWDYCGLLLRRLASKDANGAALTPTVSAHKGGLVVRNTPELKSAFVRKGVFAAAMIMIWASCVGFKRIVFKASVLLMHPHD